MRAADVKAAVDYGADAAGFVVASPQSPRNLGLGRARSLMRIVNDHVSKVVVTAARDSAILSRICRRLGPDALQLHNYDDHLAGNLRAKYPDVDLILAVPIRNNASLVRAMKLAQEGDALVADSAGPGGMGGTGRTHDWRLSARLRNLIYPRPLILAGGLTPENVNEAVQTVRPYAVDVSSGVERRVGMKDLFKIEQFVNKVKGSEYN